MAGGGAGSVGRLCVKREDGKRLNLPAMMEKVNLSAGERVVVMGGTGRAMAIRWTARPARWPAMLPTAISTRMRRRGIMASSSRQAGSTRKRAAPCVFHDAGLTCTRIERVKHDARMEVFHV
jgi:hypothetical protein